MSSTVSTQDLPNLWSCKFISVVSDLQLANTYIEDWAADIVEVASPIIQLNEADIKGRLKKNHPAHEYEIKHDSFLAEIHGCYNDALEAFPEMSAILQCSDWRHAFLVKVDHLGMSNECVIALSSHIASRIGSVISTSADSIEGMLMRNRRTGRPLTSATLAKLKAYIDNFYEMTLKEYPEVAALVERYACCKTFLQLVAKHITTHIKIQSWTNYIRLKAEGLRYLLDNDIEKVLNKYALNQQRPQQQLVTRLYDDGQRGPHNRLRDIPVQPSFLQDPPFIATDEIFRQQVDRCFDTARRSHRGVRLMTKNDARVLVTVPP
ncbi:hypothetical protein BDZ89DRAFT_1200703 [Hymenopellis radicata]|nr:hypothetical protein BDZ89DRAFT_1200703 [Hymenopellis radicata]